MATIEQSIKEQFSKIFTSKDWQLFKEIAEINLKEAVFLKKSDFKLVAEPKRLLIRNIRKRLLIGIGVELLLKAIYLKSGFAINRPLAPSADLKLPFKLENLDLTRLNANDTFTLAILVDQLKTVVPTPNAEAMLNGFRIAKVFRNKEGHVVTKAHKYDSKNFREIEKALVEFYAQAFGETLIIRFSFAVGEHGIWRIKR